MILKQKYDNFSQFSLPNDDKGYVNNVVYKLNLVLIPGSLHTMDIFILFLKRHICKCSRLGGFKTYLFLFRKKSEWLNKKTKPISVIYIK